MNHTTSSATRPNLGPRALLRIVGASKAFFFAAAFLSFLLSVWLWFSGDRERGLFVGLWVPSILSAGVLLLTENRYE